MNANDLASGRQPLLRPDGRWDHVALAAWFQDASCPKFLMPDDDLSFLGLRSGDLLIADDAVAPHVGGLVLVTDEDLCSTYVGPVELDGAGRLCVDMEGGLVPIEGKDSPHGLALMVSGYVSLPRGGEPDLRDLLRAQALPRPAFQRGRGGILMPPSDLPY